jgi:hypothetical protein
MAGEALDQAEAAEHPIAAPEDILDQLALVRGQLAESARIASAAVEQAQEQRARADAVAAELDNAKADTVRIKGAAIEEVTRARESAAAHVVATQREAKVAERAAVAAGMAQQAVGALAALLSFLVDRAPVLLTLIGAFILARDILAAPSAYQLAGLAIYGAVAIVPATWLAVRRQ